VLAKNHLQELNIAPSKLAESSCSFKPELTTKPNR
jgi:hypothetical protein